MLSEAEAAPIRERSHFSEVAVHLALFSANPFWLLTFDKSLDDGAVIAIRKAVLSSPTSLSEAYVSGFIERHFGGIALSWFDDSFISTTRPRVERQAFVLETFIRPAVDTSFRPDLGEGIVLAGLYSRVFSDQTLLRIRNLRDFVAQDAGNPERVEQDFPVIEGAEGYLASSHPTKRLIESEYAAILSGSVN